jgi:hypothetical protein
MGEVPLMRNARRLAIRSTLARFALVAMVIVLRPSNDADAKADANPGLHNGIVHLFEWPAYRSVGDRGDAVVSVSVG